MTVSRSFLAWYPNTANWSAKTASWPAPISTSHRFVSIVAASSCSRASRSLACCSASVGVGAVGITFTITGSSGVPRR